MGGLPSGRRARLLWGASVSAATCAAVGLPIWLDDQGRQDPAEDARAAYRELVLRIEEREAHVVAPYPIAPDLAGEGRDLFSPRPRPPDVAQSQARRKRPKLPLLTGVLIDGASRQAVLDGRVVAVGESVGEFRVVTIDPDAVTLDRGGATHRLTIGTAP